MFTVRALRHVQEQMLGSQLRPLSAVRKQRLAGTQLASFLATFRADLPPSLKLSLNWFFVCLFKDRIILCVQVGLELTTLVLPIECSGRSRMQSG